MAYGKYKYFSIILSHLTIITHLYSIVNEILMDGFGYMRLIKEVFKYKRAVFKKFKHGGKKNCSVHLSHWNLKIN